MPISETTHRALLLAVARHHGQLRKANHEPYVLHPLRVARAAVEAGLGLGLDGERLRLIEVVALLHDTVEDTPTSIDEIAEGFGARTADLVALLTQDKSLPKVVRKQRMIEAASGWPLEARLVKLADRLDNVRDLARGGFEPGFVDAYRRESEALLLALRGTAEALEERLAAAIAAARAPG